MGMRAAQSVVCILLLLRVEARFQELSGQAFSLTRPNCIDQSFMEHGGCGANLIAIEVSDLVISITNCVLTTQLKHLDLKPINCQASDRECLSVLNDKQKETLMQVMTNMGIYCEVFNLRKTRYIKDQFIRSLRETSDVVKSALKQAVSAHEQLQENFETALSEVKNLSDLQSNDTAVSNLLESSKRLLEEVSNMHLESISQPLDLRYLGSLVDMYTYVMAFFFKIFVIVINSAVTTSAFIDVSMFSMVSDLVVGILMDLLFNSISNSQLVSLVFSERCFIMVRLAIFCYFGICGFLIKAFKSRHRHDAENNILQDLVLLIRQIVGEDQNLVRYRQQQAGKYRPQDLNETKSRSKRFSRLDDSSAVVPAVLESLEVDTIRKNQSYYKPNQEICTDMSKILDEDSNHGLRYYAQREIQLEISVSKSKKKPAHDSFNLPRDPEQSRVKPRFSDSIKRHPGPPDYASPFHPK